MNSLQISNVERHIDRQHVFSWKFCVVLSFKGKKRALTLRAAWDGFLLGAFHALLCKQGKDNGDGSAVFFVCVEETANRW